MTSSQIVRFKDQEYASPRAFMEAALTREHEVGHHIMRALSGTGVDADSFMLQALTRWVDSRSLQNANPLSFCAAVVDCAMAGLSLALSLEEADIIPYAGKCQFQPRYGGLIKLLRQGEVVECYAHLVREKDTFEIEFGTERRIVHSIDYTLAPRERGEMIGGYAVARVARGGVEFVYMHRSEVAEVREKVRQKMGDKRFAESAWLSHPRQMAEKTLIRRLAKRLPKSDRAARTIQLSGAVDTGFDTRAVTDFHVTDVQTPQEAQEALADDLSGKTRPVSGCRIHGCTAEPEQDGGFCSLHAESPF